ncbi:hypothetical protein HXX01_01475 [Candidatus Nomurabacteria bacterium]|nr:hypothetical protein [Candidatus Nomurabacteria bacterium]
MSSCLCGRYAGAYYPYGGGYYGGGYNVYSPWVHNGYGGYGGYKPMGGGVLPMPSGNPYNWNNTGGGRTY